MKSYIVTGPTASGKSDFAHKLAKVTNGVIINCDSVQVYRGIERLSANPLCAAEGGSEIDGVPYKLFSITEPDKPLSAGIWAEMARREYEAAIAGGKTPIFVGGTGFYLKALTDGMSQIPAISDKARNEARELVAKNPATAYEYLQEIDRSWADKINPNDTQRLVRGIEVFKDTGRALSDWQKAAREPVIRSKITKILILPEKELLRERIAARMPDLAKSVLQEVGNLVSKNLSPDLPVFGADGVREIARYLGGEIDFETALELWRTKTCNHLMKHQYTWFRTQFEPDIIIDHIPTDMDVIKIA